MKMQIRKILTLSIFSWLTILPQISHAQWPNEAPAAPPPSSEPKAKANKSGDAASTKTKTTRKVIRTKKKSTIEDLGTSLIFSADVGLLSGFPATKLNSYQGKSGLAVEGKALGSVLLDKFLIDAGLGWFFYNVSGTEPVFLDGLPVVNTDGSAVTDSVGIKLSGTLLEVSPSYRIGKSMFAGPTLQLRYPSDLGYNSQIERRALGICLGAQAGYQIFDQDLNTRFVGRLMMPVNDKDWLGLFVMAGLQIGLPFTQPETLTIQESTVKTSEKKIVEYKKRVYKFKIIRDVIKLVLDNLVVFYPEPGMPTIVTESQSFLIDLSQSLSQTENNWGTLQIDTVSKDHAQVIRDALVSAGVTEKKIRLGAVLPGDKESATPPVEFTFKAVKDQMKLMAAVRNAMSAMSIPETCEEGGLCQ